jgi:hypothetical protein
MCLTCDTSNSVLLGYVPFYCEIHFMLILKPYLGIQHRFRNTVSPLGNAVVYRIVYLTESFWFHFFPPSYKIIVTISVCNKCTHAPKLGF